MHFTYQTPHSAAELYQGDVLERTAEINDVLKLVHPHFHQHPKNLYFMVLTQSCDLVRRKPGEACKAPYISIAPVRPVELVLERQIEQLRTIGIDSDLPVLTEKAKTKLSEFLARLYNNNEAGYFFLESKGTCLPGDCCAFLNLSISIRANEHFQKCIDAKRLELAAPFQAKLGWLVGQQYSRVGTEDWDKSRLTEKVRDALKDSAIWVQDSKLDAVQAAFDALVNSTPGSKLSANQIKDILQRAPTLKSIVLARVNKIVAESLGSDASAIAAATKIQKRLNSDAELTASLKR